MSRKKNLFKDGCIGVYSSKWEEMDCETGISCEDCIYYDLGGNLDPKTEKPYQEDE